MQEWLIHFASVHHYVVYFIVIILAGIEGPIFSMIFGVLIKLGYFTFWPAYISLMLGDLFGDTIWYHVGRRYGHGFIKRFGKYVSVTEENVEKMASIFHKHKYTILFASKISNGLGLSIVTLLAAGMTRISFTKYLITNMTGQFIWSGLLIGVGYFFSNLYLQVDTWMGRISIVVSFVVLIWAFFGYKKYLKNKIV